MSVPVFTARLHAAASWLAVVCLLPALALADLTTAPGEKKKKKKDEEGFLPEAKPLNVRFIAGMSVDIELDAATAKLGMVRFVIRDGPQHGTLSAIRPHPKEYHKAIVTYTHGSKADSLIDRFTYACKVDDGSWSAPAVVSLIGKQAHPKIEVVHVPSFPKVLPGFEGASKMVLKNSGIAPFASDIQWQPPWTGPPRIELGIGEQKEFLVTVKPTAPGTLIWETEIQPGEPDSRLKFYVECAQLFVVAPGRLKLQFDATAGNRRGKIGIANATDLPMKLTIELPERLQAQKEIEIQPKQTGQVEITLAPDDVAAFRGELWVINEPYRERVLIDAPPEPAQITALEPKDGLIDFGTRNKGDVAQATVVLRNIGGEPAIVSAQTAPPFRVAEKDSAMSIAPGETRQVLVEGMLDHPGKFAGNIIFTGTGGKLSLSAKATVTDPTTPQSIRQKPIENPHGTTRRPVAKPVDGVQAPASVASARPRSAAPSAPTQSPASTPPAASPSPAPAPSGELPSEPDASQAKKVALMPMDKTQAAVFGYLSTWGMPISPKLRSSHLPKIDGIQLVDRNRDSLVLAWKEPSEQPKHYLVEQGYQVLNQPTGRWLKAWRPMPNIEPIKSDKGIHQIRIGKLTPDSRYELRVLGVDEEGKVSEPSDIHIFSTPPPWRLPWWTWQVLAVIALGIMVFIFVRIKRGDWEV